MSANGVPHTPIISPPPKRSIDSLQAELEHKERQLALLRPEPARPTDHPKFAWSHNDTATKEDLEQDVRKLRSQILVKRQQEEDARVHEESIRWLKENESPTLPLHSRYTTPVYSTPVKTTPLTSTELAPARASKINHFETLFSADDLAAGQDRGSSASPLSIPEEDLFTHHDNSFGSTQDMDPSLGESSGSTSSPDHVSLNPSSNHRKRPRDSLSSPTDHVSKSMRPTPSPAITGTTTPSSFEFDLGDMANDELRELLGGDPKEHMKDIRKDQKAQERIQRERREQEQRDAEFARQLAESLQGSDDPEPPWSSPQTGPSNLSQITSQTFLDSNGRFRRPSLPPYRPSPPVFSSSPRKLSNPVKKETGASIFDSPARTKSQSSFAPARPPTVPSNVDFIDLGSDDDDDLYYAGKNPSNNLKTDPYASQGGSRHPQPKRELPWLKPEDSVNANGRHQPQRVLPWLKDENTTTSNNELYGVTPYQNQSSTDTPSALGWGGVASGAWNAAQNAAQSVYNAGQAIFNPNGSEAGLGPYSGIGTGSDPITLADADFYPGLSGYSMADRALEARGLNPYDPMNQDLADRYRERVDYLTHDPTRTTAEIKSLLENIRPDEDLPEQDREGTPEAMKYPLMKHQMLGLAWMRKMEEGSNKGGILADDMGLGKTIQALALMVSRRSTNPARKTTLIVAPVALLKQWEKEIRTKLKPERRHQLTTYIFHGTKNRADWEKLRTFDVVLTTFGTLANEHKRKEGIDMRKRENPNWRPMSAADRLPLLGAECKWYRVIIDEAQCIKNKSTKAALGAAHLQAITRFCMSGTPMMNGVGELFSLIRFLRIPPYNSSEKFNHDFTTQLRKGTGQGSEKAMKMLQALLKAILLRRTKTSKIDGESILNLPERTNEAQHATFSDDELAFYKALESHTQLQFNKYLRAGTVGRNYSNVLVLLLRLRQACCHPHLIKDFGQASAASDLSSDEMIKLAKELVPDVVARITDSTGTEEPHGLECPVCMGMYKFPSFFDLLCHPSLNSPGLYQLTALQIWLRTLQSSFPVGIIPALNA